MLFFFVKSFVVSTHIKNWNVFNGAGWEFMRRLGWWRERRKKEQQKWALEQRISSRQNTSYKSSAPSFCFFFIYLFIYKRRLRFSVLIETVYKLLIPLEIIARSLITIKLISLILVKTCLLIWTHRSLCLCLSRFWEKKSRRFKNKRD